VTEAEERRPSSTDRDADEDSRSSRISNCLRVYKSNNTSNPLGTQDKEQEETGSKPVDGLVVRQMGRKRAGRVLVTQEPATKDRAKDDSRRSLSGSSNFAWLKEVKPTTREELLMQTLVMGYAFPLNPEEQLNVWQTQGEQEKNDNNPLLPANPSASMTPAHQKQK
jgi:hypothetical protein